MRNYRQSRESREFGDFQTPAELAAIAVRLLRSTGIMPSSIIEPTCGTGAFVLASAADFPETERILCVEINDDHLSILRNSLNDARIKAQVDIFNTDFFSSSWVNAAATLSEPILFVGNPPWVTNSELSVLGSSNLPGKSNFSGHKGIEARTGKSNFDLAESVILRCLDILGDRHGTIAMLCKRSVAHKILLRGWKSGWAISNARLYEIDASYYFGVSVDACLFVVQLGGKDKGLDASVYARPEANTPTRKIGYRNGVLVTRLDDYDSLSELHGENRQFVWRSGIKHDAAKLMELRKFEKHLENGHGERLTLEDRYLFPLLKSSDVAAERLSNIDRRMLVTQSYIGEDTKPISVVAPLTWQYLVRHNAVLNMRSSSIYQKQPPYAVFGVGAYTFEPWKVAISGFYKRLKFVVVGPIEDKPVVFDDTVYFLSFSSQTEAQFVAGLLNSGPATRFLESMITWNDKRPITIDLLKRLDIRAVARLLGVEGEMNLLQEDRVDKHSYRQLRLPDW